MLKKKAAEASTPCWGRSVVLLSHLSNHQQLWDCFVDGKAYVNGLVQTSQKLRDQQ